MSDLFDVHIAYLSLIGVTVASRWLSSASGSVEVLSQKLVAGGNASLGFCCCCSISVSDAVAG